MNTKSLDASGGTVPCISTGEMHRRWEHFTIQGITAITARLKMKGGIS